MSEVRGYVPLRRGLWEHLLDGRMSGEDLGVYVSLHMMADFRCGVIGRVCGVYLAKLLKKDVKWMQRSLRRLECKGYIRRFRPLGRVMDGYPVIINRYHVRGIIEIDAGLSKSAEVLAWRPLRDMVIEREWMPTTRTLNEREEGLVFGGDPIGYPRCNSNGISGNPKCRSSDSLKSVLQNGLGEFPREEVTLSVVQNEFVVTLGVVQVSLIQEVKELYKKYKKNNRGGVVVPPVPAIPKVIEEKHVECFGGEDYEPDVDRLIKLWNDVVESKVPDGKKVRGAESMIIHGEMVELVVRESWVEEDIGRAVVNYGETFKFERRRGGVYTLARFLNKLRGDGKRVYHPAYFMVDNFEVVVDDVVKESVPFSERREK